MARSPEASVRTFAIAFHTPNSDLGRLPSTKEENQKGVTYAKPKIAATGVKSGIAALCLMHFPVRTRELIVDFLRLSAPHSVHAHRPQHA